MDAPQRMTEATRHIPHTAFQWNRLRRECFSKWKASAPVGPGEERSLSERRPSGILVYEVRLPAAPKDDDSVPVIPMIAAGTISEGAKELLQAERIGYLDRAGILFLPNDDLYILIDRPAPKEARKMDRPLFSGNRSAVVHALLLNTEQWFSTNELAKVATVSPSTVSVTFAELEKRDMVAVQG
jgi:hypothetical protein